jgi:ATP-dependent Clp protease ATP-binding subunit ClpC
VLQRTVNVALELGHNYVGTEHILLALFDGDGVAEEVLAEVGADRAAAKAEIVELLSGYLGAKGAT